MILTPLKPSKLRQTILNLSGICLGCFIVALGFVLFINPYKLVPGGVFGLSIVIAMIISRYLRVKFSNALMAVDGCVISLGLLVIGFGIGMEGDYTPQSLALSGYSLICVYVTTCVLGFALSGSKNDKIVFVIMPKNTPELRQFILSKLDRTATCLPSYGLYSGQEKEMLMLVLRRREVDFVTTSLRHYCPEAFVVVTDAYDTYGLRWNQLPDQDDLVLK